MSGFAEFKFKLEVTLVSPMLQSGLALPWTGYDAAPLVDQNGKLIISGDQVEGYVRAVMARNGALQSDIDRWFGTQGSQMEESADLGGDRANVKIFDLTGFEAPKEYADYHRIKVAEKTGASEAGAWQVIAQSHSPGKEMPFAGAGRLFAEDEEEARRLIAWINAALKIIPSLGAIKSAGFGRIKAGKAYDLENAGPLAPAKEQRSNAVEMAAVKLLFDHPFLVDHEFRSGNIYSSAEIIPGAVIKGAIADMLAMGGRIDDFKKLLSVLTIRHAFPTTGARPSVAPLSLAFAGQQAVDALAAKAENEPLVFKPDWKDKHRKAVEAQYYLPGGLTRHVRTRSAVGEQNVPIDGRLFSQSQIVTKDLHWETFFILPEGVSGGMQLLLGQLIDFLQERGIARIGKTSVRARISTGPATAAVSADGANDELRIKLQTPAWMIPAEQLIDEDGNPNIVDIRELYRQYFAEACNTAELVDFMALQSWSGGSRYVGPKSQFKNFYYPWLLTQPGSVFILKGVPAETLSLWQRLGIPHADPNRDWTNCPFVPENGFGEIQAGKTDLEKIGGLPRVS